MIFASDLDSTLIYSYRSYGGSEWDFPVRNIEIFDDREITFMTEKAIKLLREVADEMMFVPVTTRTEEQYNRISLFHEEIRPTYAITTNGGVVLKNGEIDFDWQDYISKEVSRSALSVEDVKRKIEETANGSWLKAIRIVDSFFIYLIIKPEHAPEELMRKYAVWAADHGWFFSKQGRKVYFIPSFINKWDAVHYLSEKEGKKTVYTAGDSNLDLCLIEQATFGIIPRHGEAAVENSHLGLTQKEGILAAEEILETVLLKRHTPGAIY
ncbi:HAD family hydrolase [Filibacter tadaridae]|uniref:Haloacid dehalogenase-like hydrolase n=1 Tax=Filibacter tadaridae TaxID=2483811 RepID=A0A3P5WY74_9BACL|nr:HAD family hydrolase [Filibacter tadaridae]VDC20987.1 haloacid dehalogenase-like hydrolase [Filibacter tadaridae]